MAYLNYTTQIDVHKTLGEIQAILVQHGADKILVGYQDKQPSNLTFSINTSHGTFSVIMPARPAGVLKILKKLKAEKGSRMNVKPDYEQACRVAWRNMKTWVESQLALIESEQAALEEIFLPYLLNKGGKTFFQVVQEKQFLLEGGE